jgi:hypothetical protein
VPSSFFLAQQLRSNSASVVPLTSGYWSNDGALLLLSTRLNQELTLFSAPCVLTRHFSAPSSFVPRDCHSTTFPRRQHFLRVGCADRDFEILALKRKPSVQIATA